MNQKSNEIHSIVQSLIGTNTYRHPVYKWKLYQELKHIIKKENFDVHKPLLVTGTHRSGSTWIGRVIEKSNKFTYLEEPMNLNNTEHAIGCFKYWFQYLTSKDTDLINKLQLLNVNSIKKGKRALFKDPISFFAIDSYIEKMNSDILISVRHPAAFVSSINRLGWSHDFKHFLEQEELMDDYLAPFRDEIINFTKNEKSIIEQGILLWNIINHNAIKFKQKYPEIYMVRHEDLSLSPIEEFEKIFTYFNLPFTSDVKKYLHETTNSKNTTEAKNNVIHQLHRNSKENIYSFKSRLSKEEIMQIRKGTEIISHCFYDNDTWNN